MSATETLDRDTMTSQFNPVTFGELCPRFESCNAAFCPALGGVHLEGEPVCFWLREVVKVGGEARIRALLVEELARVVVDTAREQLLRQGPLARALRAASESGSRIEAGRRLLRAKA